MSIGESFSVPAESIGFVRSKHLLSADLLSTYTNVAGGEWESSMDLFVSLLRIQFVTRTESPEHHLLESRVALCSFLSPLTARIVDKVWVIDFSRAIGRWLWVDG